MEKKIFSILLIKGHIEIKSPLCASVTWQQGPCLSAHNHRNFQISIHQGWQEAQMTPRPFRIVLITSESRLPGKCETISWAITRMSVASLRIYLNFNKRSESTCHFWKIWWNSSTLEDYIQHQECLVVCVAPSMNFWSRTVWKRFFLVVFFFLIPQQELSKHRQRSELKYSWQIKRLEMA